MDRCPIALAMLMNDGVAPAEAMFAVAVDR